MPRRAKKSAKAKGSGLPSSQIMKRRGEKPAGEPKKPRASYLFFSVEQTCKLRAEHPEWAFAEYARQAGAMWRELSADGKKVYEAMANEDEKRYARERDAFLLAQVEEKESVKTTKPPVAAGTMKAATAKGKKAAAKSAAVEKPAAVEDPDYAEGDDQLFLSTELEPGDDEIEVDNESDEDLDCDEDENDEQEPIRP